MQLLARLARAYEAERSAADGGAPTAASQKRARAAERSGYAVPQISSRALALIILLGAVLARVFLWWRAPSFWVDEISLTMALFTHPLGAILHKLDFQQLAPLGFIWMERVIMDIAGVSEHTLRFVPLLAGCVSVIAVWDVGRRLLDRGGGLLAATLIGFAPLALRYSNEAKQYGVELFVTAMLLWVRSYSGDMPRTMAMQAGVIAAGVAACLFSIPAVFVLAGLWVSYAVVALQAEDRRRALAFVGLAALIWGAAFGVIYMTLLAPNADPYLLEWWRPSELSRHLGDMDLGSRIAHGFLDPVLSIGTYMSRKVLAGGFLCLALGVYALGKLRGPQIALLFGTPLILCLAAALAGKWYLSPRLMVWTAPLCAVALAATVCWIATLARGFSSLVRLIAFDAILAYSLIGAAYWIRNPVTQDLRDAVEFGQRHLHPGDVVYVFSRAMPGWMFYSMNWAKPDLARYQWLKHATEETGPQYGNIPRRGHRVAGEGLELWRPYRQGFELVGVSEGGFATNETLTPDGHPDPGWAENEVQRILAMHRQRMILLTSATVTRTVTAMLDCLSSHGGVVVDEFRSTQARAEVIEMRGSPSGVTCP